MKLVMMAAALMLGTAAVAQTTTPEEETDSTATETTTTQTAPAPDATTSIPPPMTTAPTPATGNIPTMGTGGQTVAPGNTAPETDARGIRVISAPAEAPAGYNQGARTVPAGTPMPTVAPPATSASGPLPPCTRTVTDRCTQTYERGRAR